MFRIRARRPRKPRVYRIPVEPYLLESCIFWSGEIASRFREALTERARNGVPVRLLLDAVGSGGQFSRDGIVALRIAGCDTINNHTHRRLFVVDGRIGFTGGAGIADVWLGHAVLSSRQRREGASRCGRPARRGHAYPRPLQGQRRPRHEGRRAREQLKHRSLKERPRSC
jgi:phosphatidylserine/phosphatidylglycerophosphate/cardiolipin synthase-like enzyme